jgi:hypothetical protein
MKAGAARTAARGLTAALALAAVALAGLPSAGAEPQNAATGAVFQVAEADWIVRNKKAVWMYLAVAVHIDDPVEGRQTLALVARSRCMVARAAGMEMIACGIGGRLRKVPEEAFYFDPTLGAAALRIPRTRLDWTGEGPIYPDGDAGADPYYGAYAFASVDRFAPAAGRGRRRRPPHRGLQFGWLYEGAFAEVATGDGAGRIVFDKDGSVSARVVRVVSRRA